MQSILIPAGSRGRLPRASIASVGVLVLVIVLVIFATTACRAPVNRERTVTEVRQLLERLEKQPSAGTFADIALIAGISNDTLSFLAQDFSEAELNQKWASPLPPLLSNFRKNLTTFGGFSGSAGLWIRDDTAPNFRPALLSETVQKAIRARMQKLYQEHCRIFGDHKSDLDSEVFCESECSCIANRLAGAIRSVDPTRPILFVHMHGGCSSTSVCPWPDKKPFTGTVMTMWTRHVVIWIGDTTGGWSVIDPLVFGNVEPHPTSEWHEEFQHKVPASYFVSPRVNPIGWDRPEI